MMIKVGNEFLDFDDDIELERQVMVFEDLAEIKGDFSYASVLPPTHKNFGILGLPFPDNSTKRIYKNVFCDLINNDGELIYKGQLRVERSNSSGIEFSFFSGNYNWISLITGNVNDIDFSDYDVDLTESNIINYSVNTEGVVFPLFDSGALITRSHSTTKIEDFVPCMFMKTIIKRIFNLAGIKIKGELINDWLFNNTVIAKGLTNKTQIDDRTSYVLKGTDQTVTSGAADAKITFTDDSNFPYFDGATNNYSTVNSRYTADVRMSLQIDISAVIALNNSPDRMTLELYKNGASYRTWTITPSGAPANQTFTTSLTVAANATDYFELYISAVAFLGINTVVRAATTVKFTPIFIYSVRGTDVVPIWTKQDFVTSVLNLFNVIADFNPVSKEVTFNLFDKVKTKTPIDISQYIEVTETDFTEFISSFGKKNLFGYSESDDEEMREYNVTKFIKYGQGSIDVDNDFLEETKEIISSKFKAPISYINGPFDCSLERAKILEVEGGDETNFTSVTDSSGEARFNGIANIISDNDLIRISESTDPIYNGDWMAYATGSGFLQCRGLSFNTTATGKITKLNFKYTNSDEVFLFVNIPFYDVPKFSGLVEIRVETNGKIAMGYAYFNLLSTGRQVNTDFKQSLSFGAVDNPLFYQQTLLEKYWRTPARVLADPVKLRAVATFPKAVFKQLTPLTPVYVKTEQSVNLYYINRIFGYKDSSTECEIELIKLS